MSGELRVEIREAPELRRWEIGSLLGRGGMGSVYRATERETGAEHAVKIIELSGTPAAVGDGHIRREIANSLALNHPCVLRSVEGGRVGDAYFLVMEYCPLGSIDLVVDRDGPLEVARAVAVVLDVLDGLEYAHHAPVDSMAGGSPIRVSGLVHRDVKPANVLLVEGGLHRAKVGDFGLAKAFESAGLSGLTRAGSALGTPSFMPRQQVLDYKYVSPSVDVWAAAATLYFLLTGAPPRNFPPGRDPWQVVFATSAVPIANRGAAVPAALAAVLDEALDDTRPLAFASAASLRDAITDACRADSVVA